MNQKLIPVLVSIIISFVVLTLLSFFMSSFLLHSTESFMDFFKDKWLVILALVVVFVGYKHFFSNRK
ncbi:MAG: hypothetical protein L6264_12025 [Weeksellaceae bacterium]|nr:hypothetical protein [Bacteroidota bacterium]MCG2781666.1 hypothetical protein [Weeksellaceae bacterium]